jgi:uncharacterized cupredoxin-like copper-binding protein
VHKNRNHQLTVTVGWMLMAILATSAGAAETRTIEIKATEFAFEPSSITVAAGEKVNLKLVNTGNLSHNIHFKGASITTETVQGGDSDTITFTANADGTIEFFCNVPGHQQAGMIGEMVVK